MTLQTLQHKKDIFKKGKGTNFLDKEGNSKRKRKAKKLESVKVIALVDIRICTKCSSYGGQAA